MNDKVIYTYQSVTTGKVYSGRVSLSYALTLNRGTRASRYNVANWSIVRVSDGVELAKSR